MPSPANLSTQIGSIGLVAPVLTASGTSGHAAELSPYGDLTKLGAVTVKSLSAKPWDGNPAPRLHPLTCGAAGMINSVGLQGPGVQYWLANQLPELVATGATVVASIWGHTVDDYRQAAQVLAQAPDRIVAVEVNVSCPNTEDGLRMFAHSTEATEVVLSATEVCARPRWAKLSPNTHDLVAVAAAAVRGGAEAVVLTNTLAGLVIDINERRPVLGATRGGVSGAALHPVAVRAIFDVHEAMPQLPIVGVGGVATGADAIEMMLAGASAVQVGTATFADPRAPWKVLHGVKQWCQRSGVSDITEIIGAAHS